MKISFKISGKLLEEAERILALTDLESIPQLFEKGFTLLRIHVNAHQKGWAIKEVPPEDSAELLVGGTNVIKLPWVKGGPDENSFGRT